ncbi:hypothetical protein Tco_0838866, partial [Tanacetum coccineum]
KAHVILLPSQLLVKPKNEEITEGIIRNYYDGEDGETTPRFELIRGGSEQSHVSIPSLQVVDTLFGVAKKEISYMSNCSKNVEDLKNENENIMQMRDRVKQLITTAKEKGDRLLDGVEKWVANAESHISEAKEVIDRDEA